MSSTQKGLKEKTIRGFMWKLGERSTSQIVSFIVSVILARILSPSDYGIVAITAIFMAIANVLAISGIGTSIIQASKTDDRDCSTMFYAGLAISLLMYLILFVSAPYIAWLYKNELVCPVLRVMGLLLPISSINSIQQAIVSRRMEFKSFFYATLTGTILSGVIGLVMAYLGYGVWALVFQHLSSQIVNTIILNRIIHWHPQLVFSFARFKSLYSFGIKLMGANLIGTIFSQLKSFVIGIIYQPAQLAFFNRGDALPHLISNNVNNTINSVLFPALSKFQDEKNKVKSAIRHSMMTTAFVMMPLMIFLAASADNVVFVLLTEKWMPCVPFMRLFCLAYCVDILTTANLQTFNAIGRSDITLRLEFIKKPILLMIILVTMNISPIAIATGYFCYSMVAAFINAWPNRKLIDYKLEEQVCDVAPQFLLSLVVGLIIFSIGMLNINIYITLVIQILIGIIAYWALSYTFSLESYKYILSTLSSFRH